MSIEETNSLIEELKNLNNDLKIGFKTIKSNNTEVTANINTNTVSVSTTNIGISSVPPIIAKQHLNMDGLSDFILSKTEELVINGLDTVKDLQLTIVNTLDGKAIAAYANVIAATNTALATLNAINLERSKQNAQREIKLLDIAAKKAIGPAKTTNNTLNIVATRDTILKMLAEAPKPSETVIDISPEDYTVN